MLSSAARGAGPMDVRWADPRMERIFYRIVRAGTVVERDFWSAKVLGKPLRDPRFARQWSEGLSVYESFAHAAERVRCYRFELGDHVVALRLPIGNRIDIEQLGADLHHYTRSGTPAELLACVEGPPVRIGKG